MTNQQQDQEHEGRTTKSQKQEPEPSRDATECETPRRVRQKAMQHPVAVREDWETPPEFFAALNAEFGFTLDVCATAENAKCARYFTPADDGLTRDWEGAVCWMNPPYGAEIPKWIDRAVTESGWGATVVCLVPARVDTRWWHDRVIPFASEVRFVRGRLRFVGARYNAPFPCAVVVFRPSPSAVVEAA